MRIPKYLSPSALDKSRSDPREYYLHYLADTGAARFPQTQPMAAGSAFDAFIKSYLHGSLFGPGHRDSDRFGLRYVFEQQVEKQLWDWAWPVGKYLFDVYRRSGAAADLMLQMSNSVSEPQFEFSVEGLVGRGVGTGVSVPLLGKPDVRFVTASGVHVIYDFKVNGFCSNSVTSPMKGYINLLSATGERLGPHKAAMVALHNGLQINIGSYFESIDPKWASQLATYGWLMGEEVGQEMIIGIHQLACDGRAATRSSNGGYPGVRVAIHASRISASYQFTVMGQYQELWSRINSVPCHYFRDMTLAESQDECARLDRLAAGTNSADSTVNAIMNWGR